MYVDKKNTKSSFLGHPVVLNPLNEETLLNGIVGIGLKFIRIPCRCIFVFDPHNRTFQNQLDIFHTIF